MKLSPGHIETGKYLIAGAMAAGTDIALYLILVGTTDIKVNYIKAATYIAGSAVAFVVNKYWTFQSRGRTVTQGVLFAILYAGSFYLNVYANALLLGWLGMKGVAVFFATGLSATMNYIGQKFFIFRKKQHVAQQ